MTSAVAGGLSRVTIVTARSRIDLALPSDVQLADLLPTLLAYAGEDLANEGTAHGGWVLSRLDGQVLDASRTATQLGVRDGEVLYFTPQDASAPEIVFDDVVDAVATATKRRSGRWRVADTRLAALVIGALALLGGAAVTLGAGPPHLPGAVVGIAGAFVLVLIATVMSRAFADSRAGAVIGGCAMAYGAVGGLLVLAGDKSLGDLDATDALVSATMLILISVIATVGIADAGPVFLAAAVASASLVLAAAICQVFDAGPAEAAAVIVALAFGFLPVLPMLAYRIARLPIPSLPAGPEELKADTESVDRVFVLSGADRAHEFLTGALTTIAVISGIGSVVLAVWGELPGLVLAGIVAAVTLLRARPFLVRGHRVPMVMSGTVGLVAVGFAGFGAVDGALGRLTIVLGSVLVVAVIALGYGIGGAGKKVSPVASRALDIVEILLILAVVPLAAWVCGLYGWIRSVKG